ncbi:MAG TPA: glycine betaine/L-proline ABC transporter ATP-binding protein ProV [bacterium]|nr:glycine betaine/L-proline ABC transporter ATP-binding protein ProV [bacterium]
MTRDKLKAEHLFKVFGDEPHQALKLYRDGLSKDEIFARTGQTMGVVDASFTVAEGEIFVVMGLSGSGKSTLVRMLNRLIEPTSGHVYVDGNDITQANAAELRELRRKHISMVFQSFALMPHLQIVENVAFGLELAGVDRKSRFARARDALDQVGLVPWANSYPDELSGGMQQRVGLARALANDPSVLLMDEAFSALDPLIRAEMQDELLKLQADQQRTIIFISHDLDEAMRIGDRMAIMEGGRVVQVGTPEEILNNPADDYVRSFFRGVNLGTVLTAKDVARRLQPIVIERVGVGLRTAIQRLGEDDREFGYVVGPTREFHGVVSVGSLEAVLRTSKKGEAHLRDAFLSEVPTVRSDAPLNELFGIVAQAPCGVPVIDEKERYLGVVTKARLLEALDQTTESDNV